MQKLYELQAIMILYMLSVCYIWNIECVCACACVCVCDITAEWEICYITTGAWSEIYNVTAQ